MCPPRSFTAVLLLGVLLAGQLSLAPCPMLSPVADADPADAAAHEHASHTADPHRHDAQRQSAPAASPDDAPEPCLMVVHCGAPGIAQPRIVLGSFPVGRLASEVLPRHAYVDPILRAATPPPRA